ncbi:MAG: peptide chain release factor 1 [Candidatus Omnitrophica bacterium]|nr:peptide chain release factor 1 [Candidatus Omnitrophota bacterium]
MLKENDLLKLKRQQERFLELEAKLADQEIASDQGQYQKLAKEFADLGPAVELFRVYTRISKHIDELKDIIKAKHDKDLEELARMELPELEEKLDHLDAQLIDVLNPPDAADQRDVIIEIRAGTGGLEASIFANDLYRMYSKYADMKSWKLELMSIASSEAEGVKEVVFSLSGKDAAKRLKWESGAHRVQRVPKTEASGRIHTSAATVAVLFEPEEVDLVIIPTDLKIDVYRSSGPGGQSVNTTDSAVRITHLPTGTVVACQDERSQLKNRAKAMRILRARILDKMQSDVSAKAAQERKAQVGSGDRSEKIRTYNFPDRRITDHRIGFTTHQLEKVLDGDLDELTDALIVAEKEAKEKL